MKYAKQKGSRLKASATVAGRELDRIRGDNGGALRPAEVVKQSRPKGAPLHNEFQWNKDKAAMSHWIDQAKYIIRAVRIVKQPSPEVKPIETRAFISTTEKAEDGPVYVSIQEAIESPDIRHEVLYKAHKSLIAIKRDIAAFSDLVDALEIIDTALSAIDAHLNKQETKETVEARQ